MPRCRDGSWCIDDMCYGGRTLCGIDSSEYDRNGELRGFDLDEDDPYPDDDWSYE